MDIDLLSKMVKELILDNDYVALPGLGTFVAEIVPSTFSDRGYTINPPYRKLYFRSRPDEGRLLVDFYASSNNLGYEVADKVIRDFVAELKNVLYVKKTVLFPGLGRLRATKENAVFFVADEDLDIFPDGFGLEPVSLKTHQETPQEITEAVVELKSIIETPVVEEIPVTESAEPVAEPEPTTETAEMSVQIVEPEHEPVVKKSRAKVFWKVILWLVVVAFLLLVAFVMASRLWPEFTDALLYTTEELEILNRG